MALWVSSINFVVWWASLTQYRNDLVKAVAAVNKNVIVVGKSSSEHFAVAPFDTMLTCRRSSQCRTNHPRIDPVECQRSSHRMGGVSAITDWISCPLLTKLVCLAKSWATASSTSCTALPHPVASFRTPLRSKHPTTALRSSVVTTITPRDFT